MKNMEIIIEAAAQLESLTNNETGILLRDLFEFSNM